MATMRAVQVARPGGPLELVTREVPTPGPGTVRIKVQACGICHSDALVKEGHMAGITYPRVPGHEVAGVIDAVGPGTLGWTVGQRVGVGWNGGHCTHCRQCRRGETFACETATKVTGLTSDGGYAEYMIADATAVARMPDGLDPLASAPLLCAGITTFNALRHCGAAAGDMVAVLGLGGLGHLGVQYAAKMGFRTVAIARGADKGSLAKELGAHHYIDSLAEDPAGALQKLGGARAVIATVTEPKAMTPVISGLDINGTFMVIGAAMNLEVPALNLLMGRRSVKGWYSGVASDSEDTLAFSALRGVRSMNEVFPLSRAAEAYDRMISGKARFRVVLDVSR